MFAKKLICCFIVTAAFQTNSYLLPSHNVHVPVFPLAIFHGTVCLQTLDVTGAVCTTHWPSARVIILSLFTTHNHMITMELGDYVVLATVGIPHDNYGPLWANIPQHENYGPGWLCGVGHCGHSGLGLGRIWFDHHLCWVGLGLYDHV